MPAINWPEVARQVLLSRALDEIEERELAPAGKIAYQFSARGHELGQVLLGQLLDHPHDAVIGYYRSRPLMLSLGLTLHEALAANFARAASPSEGRDVGVIFSMPSRGGATVLPASGDVGAQFTPAAGWAHAIQYHQQVLGQPDWARAIAVAHGGDGAVAANGFWAALNIATTANLPYLFYIEDNAFAISVRSHLQTPGGSIADNLQSYKNLRILRADGSNPPEIAARLTEALEHLRANQGPCLLHVRVARLSGHTFVDDQGYKTLEEQRAERERDPLTHLRSFLPDLDWPTLERQAEAEVRAAITEAESQPQPDPATVREHLFSQGISLNITMGDSEVVNSHSQAGRINLIEATRRVLEEEMAANPRILLFGEDVGAKGGVHGATVSMQAKLGETRIFDTSLSEDGIMGRALGLALAGLLPIPEIQFRKYADPATEQINDIGTLRWRTAGKFSAPMVVRIPVGFGKKTSDPWHSVSGEAIFAHTLGWKLAYPSNAADAAGLLRAALRGNDPVLFFEHRALLDAAPARRPYPGNDYSLPFGKAARLTDGSSLALITWGAMVYPALEAAARFPGRVRVLDLRTIIPWDVEAVLEAVRQCGKCLVIHEDTATGGFGAEIIATIAEQCFEWLDAPLKRLTVPDCPIPYHPGLLRAILPSAETIGQAITALLAF